MKPEFPYALLIGGLAIGIIPFVILNIGEYYLLFAVGWLAILKLWHSRNGGGKRHVGGHVGLETVSD